jgi:signal peptidase I
MRAGRLIATFLLWAAIGGGAGVLGLVTVPRALGMTPFTILSGSMKPGYDVGDVVVDRHVAPLSVRPGDVVTFPDPSRDNALVTHRVEAMTVMGDQVAFVTRGDANTADEQWTVPLDGRLGQVAYRVPKVGWALQWARSRDGRLALIAVPATLLLLIELGGLGALRRRPAEATA